MPAMNLLAELQRLATDPTLAAGVRDVLARLGEEHGRLEQAHARQSRQLQALALKNQKLTLELAQLKRLRFGVKSEALTAEQRTLFEDDADQDLAAVTAELEATTPAGGESSRPPRAKAGRQPLPAHLERVRRLVATHA